MKRFLMQMIALLTVVSMILTACGPTAAPTEPPTAPTEAPTEAPKAEPTEAPAAEPTKEAEPEPGGGPAEATPGQEVNMVLLPKFLGILVFDQAYDGAMEAHKELQNKGELQFLGPTPENSVAGQIEIVTTAATQGMDAIMISNNAGDQIVPAAKAAREAGMTVVTWDSPIPSAEGEQLFVAQVDFDETGRVMADMALDILGEDGGKFAVLSASPDAANQNAWIAALQEVLKEDQYANLELVDIVYGNDQSEDSYNQALALVDKYPEDALVADAYFWMAENLFQRDEFKEARDRFHYFLVKYPRHNYVKRATFRIADCSVGLKEYGKALKKYRATLERWPLYSDLFPETLYSMGLAYLKNGQYVEARSMLFTALNIFPNQPYNHIIMTKIGDTYREEGKIEQALKVYSQNGVLYPDSRGAMVSEIKMADLGVKNPGFYNFIQYLEPLKVYQTVVEKYPATELAEEALQAVRATRYGSMAEMVGEVREGSGLVVLETVVGGRRVVREPLGAPVPRIC